MCEIFGLADKILMFTSYWTLAIYLFSPLNNDQFILVSAWPLDQLRRISITGADPGGGPGGPGPPPDPRF